MGWMKDKFQDALESIWDTVYGSFSDFIPKLLRSPIFYWNEKEDKWVTRWWLRQGTRQLWTDIGRFAQPLLNPLEHVIGSLETTLGQVIPQAEDFQFPTFPSLDFLDIEWDRQLSQLITSITHIPRFFSQSLTYFQNMTPDEYANPFDWLINSITSSIEGLEFPKFPSLKFLDINWQAQFTGLLDNLSHIPSQISNIPSQIETMWEGMRTQFQAIGTYIGGISEGIIGMASSVSSVFQGLTKAFVGESPSIWKDVYRLLTDPGYIGKLLVKIDWENVQESLVEGMTWIWKKFMRGFFGLKAWKFSTIYYPQLLIMYRKAGTQGHPYWDPLEKVAGLIMKVMAKAMGVEGLIEDAPAWSYAQSFVEMSLMTSTMSDPTNLIMYFIDKVSSGKVLGTGFDACGVTGLLRSVGGGGQKSLGVAMGTWWLAWMTFGPLVRSRVADPLTAFLEKQEDYRKPTRSQILEWVKMGKISREEAKDWLEEKGWQRRFSSWMIEKELQKKQLTRSQYQNLYASRFITKETFREGLKEYSERSITLMEQSAWKQPSLSTIQDWYELGFEVPESYTLLLARKGIPPEHLGLYLAEIEYKAVEGEKERLTDAFLDRYEKGYITWERCKEAIESFGVKGLQLRLMKLERDQRRLDDVFDDRVDLLQDRFEDGLMDLEPFIDELSKIIKDPAVLNLRVSESMLKREPEEPEDMEEIQREAQKYKPFSVMIEEQKNRVSELREALSYFKEQQKHEICTLNNMIEILGTKAPEPPLVTTEEVEAMVKFVEEELEEAKVWYTERLNDIAERLYYAEARLKAMKRC